MANSVVLVTATLEGHRASYVELFSQRFAARVEQPRLALVAARDPVFFLMIEEAFALYWLVGLLRTALGRRTVGLLFRPLPALRAASIRLRAKRRALRILRRVPLVTTFTIVPFSVEPRFAELADGWIHDPQMWDLDGVGAGHATPLGDRMVAAAGGRLVVSAIGIQDGRKSFAQFTEIFVGSAALRERCLFVAAGKVDPALAPSEQMLAQHGALVINRFISDAEVLDVYSRSNLVWCAYAQDYDQASGIFGRAVQLGVTPIVRRGSLIHKQCVADGLAHVAVTEADAAEQILRLERGGKWPERRSGDWKRDALRKLDHALGVRS